MEETVRLRRLIGILRCDMVKGGSSGVGAASFTAKGVARLKKEGAECRVREQKGDQTYERIPG
ncbi:MAG TPA: hypothetical protein VLZ81_09520, partial [Blastocatellia bacterium]|nr:hypothetical protein [Blastocatellia bacterium]